MQQLELFSTTSEHMNMKSIWTQDIGVIKFPIVFDHARLLKEYYSIKPNQDQINIVGYKDTNSLTIGSGSLYDYTNKKFIMENKDFKDIISMFKNTYTEEVCNYVKSIVKDINIGRIRWMLLKPKSTLSYHRDPYDLLRFHIPIMTNDNAFFIVDDLVYRMEERGNLYAINTNKKHTAVNTDKKERLHIVFDTWSN